jgi:DNA-binding LytR/AlgR family response regulator
LFFLDIYLPGISGVDAAKKIRETDMDCMFVFVTDSPDFALDGYMVQAAGYVVKPVSAQKMADAMHACRFIFERNSRVIELRIGGGTLNVSVADLFYAEVFGKDVVFHMKRGTLRARVPLDSVEKRLGGSPFLRCNRSFIVNMNYVDDMREDDFLMRNGDLVPIRKNNRREIRIAMAGFTANTPFRQPGAISN